MTVSPRVRSLYVDMYADGVEKGWRDAGAADKAANVVRVWAAAGLPPKPRVVEIGCGEGAIAARLRHLDFCSTYQGFDLSVSGIDEARRRGIPGCSFEVTEGDRMPVADDSADVVVLSHVVEHLEHPRLLLYEAARIAGHVVVEVPLELHTRTPWDYVWDDLGHINKYTATSIRHLLQTCDLDVLQQVTTNPSRAVATFGNGSWKRRAVWRTKETALRLAPSLARSAFTYHETLLARRGRPRS